MAENVGNIIRSRSRQLEEEWPFIWLLSVEVPTNPATRYRLTNYDTAVEHDFSSLGVPLVWSPFPIVHGPIRLDGRGELPRMEFQISNSSLELVQVLDDYDGLDGQPVSIKFISVLELADPGAGLRFDGQVAACRSTSDRVTFDVSAANLERAVAPAERYMRFHCRYSDYGGPRCGYDLTNATLESAFPTCQKTLAACRAHGDAEVAAGLPRLHPRRGGFYPGIPRVSRT